MKHFLGRLFNTHAGSTEQLTHDMLFAFYRNEPETVAHLAKQGAHFTPEMLAVSVALKNSQLINLCHDAGLMRR